MTTPGLLKLPAELRNRIYELVLVKQRGAVWVRQNDMDADQNPALTRVN